MSPPHHTGGSPMPERTGTIGLAGLTVSTRGLGCMGVSGWYGQADRDESVATMHRALELGVTFLDTADKLHHVTCRMHRD